MNHPGDGMKGARHSRVGVLGTRLGWPGGLRTARGTAFAPQPGQPGSRTMTQLKSKRPWTQCSSRAGGFTA